MILLKNCRLIPDLTEGFSDSTGHVLLNGKKIEAILPVDCAELPEAEQVFDIQGKTLMPGMFDLHCHVSFMHSDFTEFFYRDVYDDFFDAANYVKTMLSYGYTTLRSCGSAYEVETKVRNAVEKGIITGSRVLASGHILTPTAKGNWQFPGMYVEVDSVDDILGKVRQECVKGADFIKMMATGSVANPGGDPGELVATPAEIRATVEAAEFCGTYVAAHCHGKEGIMECIKAGVKTIEHATCIDDDCIAEIQRRNMYTAIVPTFGCMYEPYKMALADVPVPERRKEILRQCKWAFEKAVVGVRKAYEAGVITGWGTDASLDTFLQEPDVEFTARKEMGLSNIDLLKQATIESARCISMDDKYGTIKAGKLADLIIIDGNPDENLNLFSKKPIMVFVDGVLLNN